MPSTSLNTTVSRNCSGSVSMARSTSSSTMRSKKVPCGSSSWTSSKTEKGSIASMSTVSGWRVRRRYSLMKACRRMVSSQPLAFVPFSNWCQARYALSMVSWTRSSASAGLPVSRSATRYRLSRWISASRSKLARLSASAAGVDAGGVGGVGGGMASHNLSPRDRVPPWGGGGYVSRAVVHSIVPLAVLEAVKNLDTPVEDGLSEFAEELLSKRLGLSDTVAMQLREYEGMVRRDAGADQAHVEALLRLVGRRPDADLVFADAGRRAARRAVRRLFGLTRLVARAAPRVFGYAAARRAARAVFGAELRRERDGPSARVRDTLAVHATPDGAACALYGTGFTELLRLLVGFEGAMLHVSCPATGRAACEWRVVPCPPLPPRFPRPRPPAFHLPPPRTRAPPSAAAAR